jgi:hypothetical protein
MEHQWDVIEGTIADAEEIKGITTKGTEKHERAIRDMWVENSRMVRMGILGRLKAGKRAAPKKGGGNGRRNRTSESSADGTGEKVA